MLLVKSSAMSRLLLTRLARQYKTPPQCRHFLVRLEEANRFYSSQTILARAHKALTNSDLDGAKTLFRQLSVEPTATIDTLYNLGVVEWLTKNPDAAVQCWQSALA